MFIRIIYFIFVGWWLGLLAGVVGYFLCASFVGAPFGVLIFNRYPQILTLKPVQGLAMTDGQGRTHRLARPELNIIIRIIYFIVIGWWLGAIVLKVGWLLCISIIGMPFGLLFLNQLPLVMTLRQNY